MKIKEFKLPAGTQERVIKTLEAAAKAQDK